MFILLPYYPNKERDARRSLVFEIEGAELVGRKSMGTHRRWMMTMSISNDPQNDSWKKTATKKLKQSNRFFLVHKTFLLVGLPQAILNCINDSDLVITIAVVNMQCNVQ